MSQFSALSTSNCDVSNIFSGGGAGGAYVEVGGVQLVPSPFINLSLEKYRVGDIFIGGILKLTLNGTVTGNSFNDVSRGSIDRTGLDDILGLAQLKDCVYVKIHCDQNSSLIDGYGRIVSVTSSEGNQPTWVNMAPYTIEIELLSNNIGLPEDRIVTPSDIENNGSELSDLMLNNISESFSLSINDETFNTGKGLLFTPDVSVGNAHIKVNFNINAVGIRGFHDCPGNTGIYSDYTFGLEAAEAYIRSRIDKLKTMSINGLFDAPTTEIVPALSGYVTNTKSYLDFRNIEINPLENSMSVSGEIIYKPTGCGSYSSTLNDVFFNMSVEQALDVEGETVTITGTIQGLVDVKYDKIIKLTGSTTDSGRFPACNLNTKIDNAEDFLDAFSTLDNLKYIAAAYSTSGSSLSQLGDGYIRDNCEFSSNDDLCSSETPAPTPAPPDLCSMRLISSQVTRNIGQGEINFTYILSNKANCNILGTKKVDVEITHDSPRDNIVEIIIPGRGIKGVLIQNLCCKSANKYDISINATLNKNNCNFAMTSTTIDQLRNCANNILNDLKNSQGIDLACWFLTNDQETIGNTSYKLSRTYVEPSCP